jgi:pimeloyl-ACP methyl ester carboxylesterase
VNAARWIQRTLIGVAAIAVTGLLTGATYERAMRMRARRDFTVPGRLVDVGGGRRIQIDCRGAGSPTVVLESGLDNFGSLAWAAVHDSIAATTRVCAYSRAGLMWSDASDAPFESKAVARDLHTALIAAGESAPWVMVGHSLGGPYVMAFTDVYGTEVTGLVLVDASHPDQFARFKEATGQLLMPTPGIVRIGAALAWSGIVRLLPSAPPAASWPLDVDRMTHAFLPLSVNALAHEVEAIPATLATTSSARQLGDRPLVVLSAGRKDPEALRTMGLTPEQGARLQAASLALHEEEAKWSRRGRHEIVSDATHYIQFDRPDVVIRTVREVVAASVAK